MCAYDAQRNEVDQVASNNMRTTGKKPCIGIGSSANRVVNRVLRHLLFIYLFTSSHSSHYTNPHLLICFKKINPYM